ncbi:ATP-binding protein [Actinacidiphila paucisporea]|uniref:Histidine kinase-like ATPase domain-containing protein n=1 Tax=Actinacidiphila paucisporea TaxID=310782 RepID=A0A1M6TJC6_9ACTN|nr:ATP-binding protein [Actinacidiphila paucisporea]SHK57024.1 Histidine kinase-like ATPase domain-containing protein [Actinacidiphila paucisporea]
MTEFPKSRPFAPPEPRTEPVVALRLLPWQGPEGRPATLNGDGGYLSRLADEIEDLQLDSARVVFDLAPAVLDNPATCPHEVRFAARRLRESLGDVLKIAESRRLPGPVLARQITSPHVKRWTYEAHCVGEARHDLRFVLHAWSLGDLAERAELILSELLTNAVRHTDPSPDREIETRYELLPAGVRIEVHDADERWPTRQDTAADAETGRGLALVDALTSASWGVSTREGIGKLVWAVVERDDNAQVSGEAAV